MQAEQKIQISWTERLYALFYLIGAVLIRRYRHFKRRGKNAFLHLKWKFRLAWDNRKEEQKLRRLMRNIGAQPNPVGKWYREYLLCKREHRSVRQTMPLFAKAVKYIGNYLLPAAGMLILLWTANYFESLNYALRLELNGDYVGHIYQEEELLQAQKEIQNRLIYPDENAAFLQQPVVSFEAIQPDQHTPMQILANNLIRSTGQSVEQAAGLYVDGKFLGAVKDGDAVLSTLSARKEETRKQYPDARVEFVQEIRLEEGLYPEDSLVEQEFLQAKLDEQSSATRTYTVQEGDSPYTIAQELNMPLNELIHMNPQIESELFIGDELLVQQAKVTLEQRAVETVVRTEEIPFSVSESIDQNKDVSYQKVTQEGKNGLEEITAEVTYIGGMKTDEQEISRKILRPAVEKKVVKGSLMRSAQGNDLPEQYQTKNASVSNAGGFIWPVDGGAISCDINGYYGHTGNDIKAPKGTAIWASKAGTVAYAGWSRGYGYNVLIDHGDGYKTRYAHCSTLLCSTGQTVEQGQQIAMVGRTGNATCDHCHFEVIQNSQFLDSRDFVGSR